MMEYSIENRHIFEEIFKHVDVKTLGRLCRVSTDVNRKVTRRLLLERELYIQVKINEILDYHKNMEEGYVNISVNPENIDKIEELTAEDRGLNRIISRYKDIHALSYIDIDGAIFSDRYDVSLIQHLDVNLNKQYRVIEGFKVDMWTLSIFLRQLIEKNIMNVKFISLEG